MTPKEVHNLSLDYNIPRGVTPFNAHLLIGHHVIAERVGEEDKSLIN